MKDFIVRRINPNLIQPTRAGPAGIFSYIHKKTKEQKEKEARIYRLHKIKRRINRVVSLGSINS
jgi:hypothetical protein